LRRTRPVLGLFLAVLLGSTGCGPGVTTSVEGDDRKSTPTPTPSPSPSPRPPDAAASTVAATPAQALADGADAATVTVTVRDDLDRPLAGVAVALAASASAAVTPASSTSDASGVALFHVTSRAAGVVVLTATARDGERDVVLAQRPAVTFAAAASLTLSATSVTVSQGETATVGATAVAAGGGAATVGATSADPSIAGVAVVNGPVSATLTLSGVSPGSTTVRVTNEDDPDAATRTRTLAVTVVAPDAASVPDGDGYGSIAARAYPSPGATAAHVDGDLTLTFDAAPSLGGGGAIEIRALGDGSLVDRIAFAGESQTIGSTTVNVGTQLARVSGNTVHFTPHFGKLAYASAYYVAIADGVISGALNGRRFTGFSSERAVASWRFTTRAAPRLGTTVHVDGSQQATAADFRTLGGALMYLAAHPVAGATAVRIQLAPGTYVELPHYRPATPDPALTITISGPAGNRRGDDTVVQYTNGARLNASTRTRALLHFQGANLVLENLTLRNTGVRAEVAQAEALHFASGAGYTVAAHNCSFVSRQDTLLTTGRAWFHDCYVEGNTDFIWGTADVALLERCSLRVVNDSAGATYAIVVSRTGATGAATVGKGYVLLRSEVAVDAGITAAYGRQAGSGAWYDQVAIIGNTFAGGGRLATGLWLTGSAPSSLGDSSHVGWKASGNTGLGADTAATAAGTASTVAALSSEYDTRDRILNRVITVAGGAPTGFAPAGIPWDVAGLAAAWGAP
jgi:pectin methylesterase-like acyl-CoA thioesterase